MILASDFMLSVGQNGCMRSDQRSYGWRSHISLFTLHFCFTYPLILSFLDRRVQTHRLWLSCLLFENKFMPLIFSAVTVLIIILQIISYSNVSLWRWCEVGAGTHCMGNFKCELWFMIWALSCSLLSFALLSVFRHILFLPVCNIEFAFIFLLFFIFLLPFIEHRTDIFMEGTLITSRLLLSHDFIFLLLFLFVLFLTLCTISHLSTLNFICHFVSQSVCHNFLQSGCVFFLFEFI